MRPRWFMAMTGAFTMAAGAAHAQAVLAERTISAAAAREAASVALEQCRKEGHRVTVTVLDHAARTKVVLRDDGASPHSLQHSLHKAYTALDLPRAFRGLRQARGGGLPAERGRR